MERARYFFVERRMGGNAYPPVMAGTSESHHVRLLAEQRWTSAHASIKIYRMNDLGEITLDYELKADSGRPGEYRWARIPVMVPKHM